MGYKTIDPKENMVLQERGYLVVGIKQLQPNVIEYEFNVDTIEPIGKEADVVVKRRFRITKTS